MRTTGQYENLGSLSHFIPNPLPPQNPPLQMDDKLIDLYGKAMHALGQLNEMAQRVPNVQRFIKAYMGMQLTGMGTRCSVQLCRATPKPMANL